MNILSEVYVMLVIVLRLNNFPMTASGMNEEYFIEMYFHGSDERFLCLQMNSWVELPEDRMETFS